MQHLLRVHEAAEFIGKRLLKARIPVSDYKEKWGTVRVYCSFEWWSFHDLVYPGYAFNRFPRWLSWLDWVLLSSIVQYLSNWASPLQIKWYRSTYKKALEKFPDLRDAILESADWPEHLEGL